MIKVGSIFSGVGMWELGLKYLGIDHKQEWMIEFDKYAIKSHKAIHGEIENYGDVTKVKGDELADVDLIFYSPPCQAFSVAGKGLGTEDERGILFFDAYRIIKAKMPKIAIMENVKGLTNKKHKETFETILRLLSDAGYNNYWDILNTKDYGIPQNRERIFIVSIRKDTDKGYQFPGKFDNGIRLKDVLEDEVDEKYYISQERVEKLLEQIKDKNQEVSYCIDANYAKGTTPEGFLNKSRRQIVAIPCLTPDRANKRQNGRRFKEDGEPSFTLTSQDRHGILTSAAPKRLWNIYGENLGTGYAGNVWDSSKISPTLTTMQGGGREPMILTDYRIRKLTPKECWRLQGIKDEDFEKAEKVNSNSQLYKQAGNGVSVNVVMELINKLKRGYLIF